MRNLVFQGWRNGTEEELTPYNRRKEELSVEDGCVLWGRRIVAPPAGKEKVLNELHNGHPGITRMKSIARRLVWWPDIDRGLES